MALDPRQRRFLDRFFPGLIKAIEALGKGEFAPNPVAQIKMRGEGIRHIEKLNALYKFDDGWTLDLRTSSALVDAGTPYVPSETTVNLSEWQRTYYSLDYRETLGLSLFRVCFTAGEGRHVHIRKVAARRSAPPELESLHVSKITPDTHDLDPRTFVEWVAHYRATGTYPLTRAKP